MGETARRVAEPYFRALTTMDEESWVAMHAPDAQMHDPAGSLALHGREPLRRFFRSFCSAFEQLEIVPTSVFSLNGTVAVLWAGTGLGRNGRRVTFQGIHVLEVDEDGSIRRSWGFWDPDILATELQRIQ